MGKGKWRRRAIKAAAALLALLAAGAPLYGAHFRALAAAEPVKIQVELNDGGFNGNSGEFDIEVEQGQTVEITFVWHHTVYPQEEHILVLEGYKLETDKINAEHPDGSFKFLADKVGTFNFKCDSECETHDLFQKGYLKVKSGSGGGAAASGGSSGRTPTSLALRSSTTVQTAGKGPLTLTATLKDESGVAIPKAEVHFLVDAEFAGTKGQMEIGAGKTDANGVATLNYQPTIATSKLKITAHADAVGIYDESQQAIEIDQIGEPPSAYAQSPTGLDNAPTIWLGSNPHSPAATAWSWSINHWGPLGISAVVLIVWSTLAYALFQVYGISRVRDRR